MVRNGYHPVREAVTSAGAVEVSVPRANHKRIDAATGQRMRFASAIVPPWCRKTPKITEVLPLLYLHGLSSGDFVPALGQLLGSPTGLSSSTVTKLIEPWQGEQRVHPARPVWCGLRILLVLGVDGVLIQRERHLGLCEQQTALTLFDQAEGVGPPRD